MKIIGNKMLADEGYVFATKERDAAFGNIMYLGIYDSPYNYIEISEEEAAEINKEA